MIKKHACTSCDFLLIVHVKDKNSHMRNQRHKNIKDMNFSTFCVNPLSLAYSIHAQREAWDNDRLPLPRFLLQNIKVRGLLLCQPQNPLGILYSEKQILDCMEFAER